MRHAGKSRRNAAGTPRKPSVRMTRKAGRGWPLIGSSLPEMQKNDGVSFQTNGPAAKSAGPFPRLAKRKPSEPLGLGRPQFPDQIALNDDLCHWPSRQP
jgi:hypothetical protein